MKPIICTQCGANEFVHENGYIVCKFCNTRYAMVKANKGVSKSTISVHSDVKILLEKCRTDKTNARKYANLILDIDPNNVEARRYL